MFVPGQVFNFVDMAADVVCVVFTILQARFRRFFCIRALQGLRCGMSWQATT